MRLQIGDAVCVTSNDQVARLIRFFQSGCNPIEYFKAKNPSHVAPVIVYENEFRLADATSDGLVPSKLDKFNNNNKIKIIGIKRIPGLTDLDRQKINNFLIEKLGVPYDWRGIVEFLIPIVKDNPKYYYCSEITEKSANINKDTYSRFELINKSKISPLQIWKGKASIKLPESSWKK